MQRRQQRDSIIEGHDGSIFLRQFIHQKVIMKNKIRQQEILLMINSSLSKRTFCEKDVRTQKIISAIEQLEEYCWNGLLESFLPDIAANREDGGKLFLWHIQQTDSFLHIDLCERPVFSGEEYSIDPYFFMSYSNMN